MQMWKDNAGFIFSTVIDHLLNSNTQKEEMKKTVSNEESVSAESFLIFSWFLSPDIFIFLSSGQDTTADT